MSEKQNPSIFSRLATSLQKLRKPEVQSLNLTPTGTVRSKAINPVPAAKAPTASRNADARKAERYLCLTDPVAGVRLIGSPMTFLPGARHSSIEPGSHDLLGNSGIWGDGMRSRDSANWCDDPESGVFRRKTQGYKSVLGCKGSIEEVPYAFDSILQVGKNTVVYHLTNLKDCTTLAIGLGRDAFDPLYGLVQHLHHVGKGETKYVFKQIVQLCDRVLAWVPTDETALFNKGVALMTEKRFLESQVCFQNVVDFGTPDQLTLLHNAATLAHLGEDHRALLQFVDADIVSVEQCKATLHSFGSLAEPLNELLKRSIQADAGDEPARDLWVKYFTPDIESIQ